jgi:hypothetical protein
MSNEMLLVSFPAFSVFSREADTEGFVEISDADVLALKSERSAYTKLYYTGNV